VKKTLVVTLIMCALFSSGCRAGSGSEGPVRPPAVAGQFYPSSRDELESALAHFFGDAIAPRVEKPLALIVPHAGYVYSGQIAADGFRQASNTSYDAVFILGTNHTTAGFSGVSVYASGGFRTPLGVAEVDAGLAAKLIEQDKAFVADTRVHEREHSVEVQVPFVQHAFPKAKIVPLVVGEPDAELCEKLGRAIAAITKGRSVLVVASSDLSHYPAYEDAVKVDHATLRAAASLDPERLETTLMDRMKHRPPQLSTCACGEGPMLAAMAAAKAMGATRGVVISAANSGDVAVGEYDRVVGYGAVVFTTGTGGTDTSVLDATADSAASESAEFPVLSAEDKKVLLAHARKTLDWYLSCQMVPESRGFSRAAQTPAGAFVTLKKHGELRGCIGHMAEDMPLCRTVSGMALMAGLEDRRFSPVTAQELPNLEIEISVLTPARPVPDASHIVVGRDGVTLSKSGRSAVFLPQVAPEQGWSRDTMLDHLCLKAGLPKDAWRQGATLATFQAIVFSESEF